MSDHQDTNRLICDLSAEVGKATVFLEQRDNYIKQLEGDMKAVQEQSQKASTQCMQLQGENARLKQEIDHMEGVIVRSDNG